MIKTVAKNIFYSFPIQLLVIQLRRYQLMVFIWVFLAVLVGDFLKDRFGISYLFLNPEYLEQVSFVSYTLVGICFGALIVVWNLALYVLTSFRFPFLASLDKPFTKFCVNNFILPTLFFLFYLYKIARFQIVYEYASYGQMFSHLSAVVFGILIFVILSGVFFQWVNNDIGAYTKKFELAPHTFEDLAQRRLVEKRISKHQKFQQAKVRFYVNEFLKLKYVRSVEHYSSVILDNVFKQNHRNAFLYFVGLLGVLVTLGLLIEIPIFRLPTGATLFLVFSLFVSIIGGISFWFKNWSSSVIIGLIIIGNLVGSSDVFNIYNPIIGLDYQKEPSEYSPELLVDLATKDYEKDKDSMLVVLNNWKAKQTSEKPKLVFNCFSGGGIKATVWSFHILSQLDERMAYRYFDKSFMYTGASGGLIGAAYYRELRSSDLAYLQDNLRPALENAGKDLQRAASYAMVVNDLFIPWLSYDYNGQSYRKDRGYIFEKSLSENTDNATALKFNSYISAEKKAELPLLLLSPVILNDQRNLLISTQPISFMTRPPLGQVNRDNVDGVEFAKLFNQHGADEITLASALRMNASYPYILPSVELPSFPRMSVADAGYRDNFGVSKVARFCMVFEEWIKENTSGVVIAQMNVSERSEEVEEDANQSIFKKLLNPIIYALRFEKYQGFNQDELVSNLQTVLGEDKVDVVKFTYKPSLLNKKASMSFHLTEREKLDILEAIFLKENTAAIIKLKKLISYD